MLTTIRGWFEAYPALTAGMWLQFGLACVAVMAMPFDHRYILGINPWIKPLKFDVSVWIVMLTIAALLSGFQRLESARNCIAVAVSISLSAENLLISMQALRGVRSHMNYSTAFDARVFMAMAVGIVVSTIAVTAVLALVFVGKPKWPAAVTWGAALGLVVFIGGSMEGVFMVIHGSHTVGAADGSHGLPFINWSTTFGDLRIAHFFALHSLQVFPLLGWLLSRTGLSQRLQVGGVVTGSACYTLLVWLMFREAMSGKPLLS